MRGAPALLIALMIAPFALAIVGQVYASPLEIENRIIRAAEYSLTQYHSGSGFSGFLHSSNDADSNRSYTRDNALMALALSAYQETHFSTRFYTNLTEAIESLEKAQTIQGDFHEYYDFKSSAWGPSGEMYCWDAYAVMGSAYAAYAITTTQSKPELTYWLQVVNRLRVFIDDWIPKSQGRDGAIMFSFPNGGNIEDLSCNGVLLMGLMYVAAFDFSWGDKSIATAYAGYSQRIANWLYSLQEGNQASWGFGGFYSNSSRNVQASFDNALAMFGLNSYYKIIGLVNPSIRGSLEQSREAQKVWADMYEEKITDQWGGVSFSRTAEELNSYPKTTQDASATLAAMVDVWVNLGPSTYWNDCAKIYAWMIGNNERSSDLQSSIGNFYSGIAQGQVMPESDLTTTSLALYSLIKAQFISIPGQYPIAVAKTTRSTITVPSATSTNTTQEQPAPSQSSGFYVLAGLSGLVAGGIVALLFATRRRKTKKKKR